jgi:hypothetical protein
MNVGIYEYLIKGMKTVIERLRRNLPMLVQGDFVDHEVYIPKISRMAN